MSKGEGKYRETQGGHFFEYFKKFEVFYLKNTYQVFL